MSQPNWEAAAKRKRDAINHLIPSEWRLPSVLPPPNEQRNVTGSYITQYLSPREVEITETPAVEIVRQTSTGQWKAREVAEAFCHRAALAHQMTNCLHEIFFDAALADAEKLDEYLAQHKKPVGALHGLPISLKDQFHVRGVETTMGYVGWINTFEGKSGTGKEKVVESELVRVLRAQGATLYCKTSVPHTLMSGETVNNIIGYTWNPHNRLLTSGGSSGGEGALIALKGSPLGVGSDIGGSVRIPSAFSGLYGLKPSTGRIPYQGVANSMDGQISLLSALGPMANSVGDLRLFFEAVMSSKPWFYDPLVAEIPWRRDVEQEILAENRKCVFGVLMFDGTCSVQPPVRRAIEMVVEAVKKQGHKVIEWKPPSHQRGVKMVVDIWTSDGGHDVHSSFALANEPISRQISSLYGEQPTHPKLATEMAKTNMAKRAYQKEYMDYWNSTANITGTGEPVDGLIMPVAPMPAARPNMYHHYGYTMIANLLDYPAAVLPVTFVDKDIDVFDNAYKPLNKTDEKVWRSYDADIYHGAPVAVQVVGRRFQEEKVLALTEKIANALPTFQPPEPKL